MSKQIKTLSHTLELIKDKKTNPLRRAYLINQAIQKEQVTKQELAYLIKKSPSYISNYLRLLKLPEVIRDALLSGIITEGHCRTLSFLENQQEAIHILEDIIRHNYSVRDTEREVGKLRKVKRQYGKVAEEIKNHIDHLIQKYGVEMKISRRKKRLVWTLYFPIGAIGNNKFKKLTSKL